jgi:hypothetical protein
MVEELGNRQHTELNLSEMDSMDYGEGGTRGGRSPVEVTEGDPLSGRSILLRQTARR